MSTDPAGCTARAVMEAAASAALARYLQALDCGTRRQEAERAYRDHILRAWDRTVLGADAVKREKQIRARDLDAALEAIRRDASPADILRAERTDIGRQPTYGTRRTG